MAQIFEDAFGSSNLPLLFSVGDFFLFPGSEEFLGSVP